jgi:CTP:molybdopterin cytidylyltransferase MocA
MRDVPAPTVGIVLAAGAGRRYGGPKGLVVGDDGRTWAARAADTLLDGGCTEVVVTVGAEGDRVAATLPAGVTAVPVADWQDGQHASLRAGLAAAADRGARAAVVLLVDLPDVGTDVVRRVLDAAGADLAALARATYDGRPGHPVVIGAAHFAPVTGDLHADEGAQRYLKSHDPVLVECGDLATGRDVDTRPPGPDDAAL